ncbi:hypothetical protein SEA_NAPOLEONB_80 [Arthrobacter phage NapoleonB]|uniref:Uncharacterized protein n=1 Tax=Arthrobacter phage Dynamite TaxID=2867479 RepID=A0AAE9BR05_9CAUD|nr:hypothetical protein PQB82_gp79 [Arthrobacter phage Dynamite]QFP95048.1 hypothetical protein SEA_NAPOLEONB_80 [Arthrobacter phage NapoleonB]UAW09240.1 hypothetical protein SEA_DYNAMITE_79 [Arthrobacter phage Dynamite]WBF79123.1 hypothetical protein SEA_HANKLY_79 [Arthrobacter phage Hankly]
MLPTTYTECEDQNTPGHEHLWDYNIDYNVYVCTRKIHDELYSK